ncbi:hypothetical protein O7635_13945 [Asanoa sp. WMMD1127]|uniref:hypothetical protein n=1 Tax=Asanoa sp. WMMD1127 TaxID=3016107 RepID=UPI0024168976|nr:hypothetical protein [Asanoa sp. WMMD1127]MDG4822951.1 hypothetical protein [Asanoa sp. WMMD1127]
MKRRLRPAYAAVPIAFLLALAGCGGAGGDDGSIASVGGTPTAAASSSEPPLEDMQERALKFAQCMREHGVDMPDPEFDGGRISQRINADKGVDVEAAQEACKEYAPSGPGGGKPDPQMRERMLAHAQCMRENGVESFPDPAPDEAGIRIDGKVGSDPDFEKAQKACEDKLGEPK